MTTYYHYSPADKAHVTDTSDGGGTTLCGLSHGGDVEEVGESPDRVLPKHTAYCYRCRAAYFGRVRDALDVDTTSLEEGAVIEYWVRDVTDPSEGLARRKEAVIVEVPPWTRSMGGDDYTMETKYKVRIDSMEIDSVHPKRIWRVNHTDPEDALGGGVGDEVRRVIGGGGGTGE